MQTTRQNHITQQVTHARQGAQLNCILYKAQNRHQECSCTEQFTHIQQFCL